MAQVSFTLGDKTGTNVGDADNQSENSLFIH